MANNRKAFNFRSGLQVDNDNFVVNANGLVGIGTSAPEKYHLNVYGDTRTTGLTTTRDLYVTQNAEISGITTVGVLTASSVSVGGTLTVSQIKIGSDVITKLIGYARTTFITDNGGIGLHTTSKLGINTTISPGASDPEFSVFGNVDVTGIITATTFSGNVIGDLNSSGISTFTELKVGTAITMSAGIVTATTFIGNLTGNVTGIATTATNLADGANITTGTINDARLPDLITSNINILSGTSYFNKIGVNTTTPSSDIHVRNNIQTEIQVTSDSNASLIGLGRSESITGFNGVLRYGNTDSAFSQFSDPYSLDIMNYGTGNLNFYLNPSSIAGTTGGFYWHKETQRLMALTSAGNLGVGLTNPLYKLQVNGTAYVSGDVEFGNNLNLTNNLILGSGGNIGINSSSPAQKLDVVGNIAATGSITAGSISTTSGTSSQFLKADGSIDSSTYLTSALQNVVEDTSPELGGNLNLNSKYITGTGGIDLIGIVTASGAKIAGIVTVFGQGIDYQWQGGTATAWWKNEDMVSTSSWPAAKGGTDANFISGNGGTNGITLNSTDSTFGGKKSMEMASGGSGSLRTTNEDQNQWWNGNDAFTVIMALRKDGHGSGGALGDSFWAFNYNTVSSNTNVGSWSVGPFGDHSWDVQYGEIFGYTGSQFDNGYPFTYPWNGLFMVRAHASFGYCELSVNGGDGWRPLEMRHSRPSSLPSSNYRSLSILNFSSENSTSHNAHGRVAECAYWRNKRLGGAELEAVTRDWCNKFNL